MEVRRKQRKALQKSAGFEGEDVEEVDLQQQVQLLKEQGNALAEAGKCNDLSRVNAFSFCFIHWCRVV